MEKLAPVGYKLNYLAVNSYSVLFLCLFI